MAHLPHGSDKIVSKHSGFQWSHLPVNRDVIVKFTAIEVDLTTWSFCIFKAQPLSGLKHQKAGDGSGAMHAQVSGLRN
jgi:hypothetical protein